VARPSIVVGRYHDGTIGQFTNIYALIRLVNDGPYPCPSRQPLREPRPRADRSRHRRAGRYRRTDGGGVGPHDHLVSDAPVPVAALRTLPLGYQHLHAPRFVPPETFERVRLTRAEQTLDRHVTSLYASYLQE
jgi:hypothetical protein